MNEEFDDIDLHSKLDGRVWKKIIHYLKPYKWYVIVALLLAIAMAFLETFLIEFLTNDGFDKLIKDGQELISKQELVKFIVLLLILIIIDAFVVKYFHWCVSRLELNLYKDLSNKVFDHLQSLSFSFYDKYSVGWLMARTISDAERVGEIISWGISDMVWSFFKLIFIFITMFRYNPKLSLIMVIIVPLLVVISIFFRKVIVKFFWRVRRINSQVTSALNEGISGAKTSKTLVLEDKNLNEFKGLATKYKRTSIKSTIYTSMYYQVIAFMAAIGIGCMTYFGSMQTTVMIGETGIKVSVLFMFISYTTMFFEPVLSVARVTNELKHAQVSATRIFNLLDVKSDINDSEEVIEKYGTFNNPKKENWESLNGDIEFKNVGFNYTTGSKRKILDNFNLNVKKGQNIALVGETGAGKSTIVNLLCRFYEPTEGQILIDGKDYKQRSVGWLHANLGYVMQTPHLFSGTIKDNILYGNREASLEDVISAAKIANAHDFIMKLEKGYETEVGEGGNRLSQGQKQLISFARAIIANPKILILDEATSSIDTETEVKIQSAIKNILENRTSFIVAHRLSTIVNCDKILVILGGKIFEQGSHEELMKLKGYYYKLYTNQFIEDKLKVLGVK